MRTTATTLLLVPFACLACERGVAQDPAAGQAPIAAPDSGAFPAPKVRPASDTVRIYVSTRFGSDDNDGTAPELPLKTLAAATKRLRPGKPDWLLLRRGDAFRGTIGHYRCAGVSAAEPAVVGAYGKGPRPRVLTGAQGALWTNGGGGSPKRLDHVLIQGIHFYADTRDPASRTFRGPKGAAGIHWLVGATGLVIDDCVFQAYGTGLSIQDFDKLGITGVVLRRTQVLDSYGTRGHSEGLYASRVNGLTIEGCLFDHNGWNEQLPQAKPTIFNHDVYIQTDCRRVVLRRNIILRGASHGAQVRCGGVVEENLFARNAIALLIGGGDEPVKGGVTATVKGNVILEGRDIRKDLPRGWGIGLENIKRAVVSDTIVANVLVRHGEVRNVDDDPRTTYRNVIVYRWGKSTRFPERDDWKDPGRTLAGYQASLGEEGGFEGLVAHLRRQARGAWDPRYSAEALIAWVREGFHPR